MSSEELKAKGNAALQQEKYDEAIKYYSEAIQLDPKNHILFSNRSAAYAKTGKYSESLVDAEETIKLKKDWPKGYSRKGAALELLERYPDALKTYEEGLKYDASNEQLKEALKNCRDNLSKPSSDMGGMGFGGQNPFSDPRFLANLAMNPKTRELLADKEVQDLLKDLQKNPNDIAKLLNHPKASQLLGAMFGGMGGGPGGMGGMGGMGGDDDEEFIRETSGASSSSASSTTKPPEPPKPDPKANLSEQQRKVTKRREKSKTNINLINFFYLKG